MTENLKQKHIYFLILLLYIVLVFIIGYNHEPWGDEAQSWLIARDNSFFEIFKETKYEGHPFVWFFIEKTIIKFASLFINTVNLYNYLFLVPLFLSAIGVYLFLYKSNFPLWIKIVCPFTFYIFYQYGIIARNHCLCFPMLAILAVFYEKRFKHPYIYITLLIINANISAYLYVISCVLILFFIIDIIKNKLHNNKSCVISSSIAVFLIFFTAINMYTSDGYFWLGLNFSKDYLFDRFAHIANIYFPTNYSLTSTIIGILLLLLFYWSVMRVYCKDIYQKAFFISLNLSVFAVYICVYMQNWHYGYAFVALLFVCWILTDINKIDKIPFKSNLLFYGLFSFVVGYYIINALQVGYFEIKNSYSGSKDAAKFLKEYNLLNYKITAVGMKSVALQPYFAKNIYNNFVDSTHFSWKNDFVRQYNEKRLELTPVIVLANFDMMFLRQSIDDYIQHLDQNYEKYNFSGEMRGLNYHNGNLEDNSYTIYINKELSEILNIKRNNDD